MSNQRVVVLTDEEIEHTVAWLRASTVEMEPESRGAWATSPVGRVAVTLDAALKYPGGVTDYVYRARWRWKPGGPLRSSSIMHKEEVAVCQVKSKLEVGAVEAWVERAPLGPWERLEQ